MKNKYYKDQTEAGINSFGKRQSPYELIRAFAEVKKAIFFAIQEYKSFYTNDDFEIIIEAIDEIIEGKHNDQFPLDLAQGGAGTSLHMNINEVISSLVYEKTNGKLSLDYIDDCARYQSTNDTFPTAIRIVLYRMLIDIEKNVIALQEILVAKEKEYHGTLMTARTELQDALPMDLGQVFGAWAGMIERDRWRLNKLKERIRSVPLGGTAVGTGFFAPQQYVYKAERFLQQITGLPLCRSQNLPDAIAHHDELSELASGIKIIAQNIYKITNDLLKYTSSQYGEMTHISKQYGSSIMAAKSNPVLLEYIKGLVISTEYECDKASRFCSEGEMQLNAFIPFALKSFLYIDNNINNALDTLKEFLLNNLEINREKMTVNLLKSNAILNTLRPLVSYHKIKEASVQLQKLDIKTIDEFIDNLSTITGLSKETLKKWMNPDHLTGYTKEIE